MILQTKASTLIALMAAEGRQAQHQQAVNVIDLGFGDEDSIPPKTIGNDRTTLKHYKKKKTKP